MKIKANLRNHCTCNTVGNYVSVIYIFHHFNIEHHFQSESIKNEFFDLENLQNMRYASFFYIVLYFHGGHFEKSGCHFDRHHQILQKYYKNLDW